MLRRKECLGAIQGEVVGCMGLNFPPCTWKFLLEMLRCCLGPSSPPPPQIAFP